MSTINNLKIQRQKQLGALLNLTRIIRMPRNACASPFFIGMCFYFVVFFFFNHCRTHDRNLLFLSFYCSLLNYYSSKRNKIENYTVVKRFWKKKKKIKTVVTQPASNLAVITLLLSCCTKYLLRWNRDLYMDRGLYAFAHTNIQMHIVASLYQASMFHWSVL